MSRRRQAVMAAVLCAVLCESAPALSQSPPAPPPAPPSPVSPSPDAAQQPAAAEGADGTGSGRRDDVVRVASDYALKSGDSARDLVVVMGNATVDGHVTRDLVVVLGEAQLGPGAVVDGDVAVIGGTLHAKAGATIKRQVVVVAGSLDAPADFAPQGQQVIIGFKGLGDAIRGLLPWLTRGFLLGRPIVPDLPWVWAVVGVLFAMYLGVLLIFERPVRLAADTLTATPLRSLATGLGTLLLAGPLVLLLTVSVVGLLVVPFAACALLVMGLVGKVAANAWLGARLLPEGDERTRITLVRAFVAGCAVLILTYMVPVLGGVVWASASAVGLGAAVLAFVSAYRRENPPAERAPILPLPPLPVPDAQTVAGQDAPGWFPSVATPLASPASPASEAAVLLAMPHATFADRLAAFVLDGILVALFIYMMSRIDGQAFVPLLLAYRFALWAWKGATIGDIVCQLRVIRVDGGLVGPGEAIIRSLASIFSFGIFGLGCLWILRDADRQAWHDKIAGTFVVKVPRQWPI